MTEQQSEQLFSIKAAARYAKCSANQVRHAIRIGALQHVGDIRRTGANRDLDCGIRRRDLLEWRLNTVNYFAYPNRLKVFQTFFETADWAKVDRTVIERLVNSVGMVMDCLEYCDLGLSPDAHGKLRAALGEHRG